MPKLDHQPNATDVPREAAPHLPGIRVMSPTHTAILEHIVANPGANHGEIAQHFGVTQAWLSCIIHSDCFQTRLAEVQEELYGDVRASVKDRLQALAHRSLFRLSEKIEVEQSTALLTDAAEMALKALGFAGQQNGRPVSPIYQQNNYFAAPVDKATLATARAMMESRQPLRLVHDAEVADVEPSP